ncbi:MAG: cell division topological specificity factor MinE [Chloroflexia bacterium]|jgi:cell division topological specificity factor|nr:cell division topological specificity factor MinE [Chloroflexia bacterium]
MSWLDTLLGRRPQHSSASLAKQRLVEVLVQDHVRVTPEMMDAIRHDIYQVIARHLDVDANQLHVNITRSEHGESLVANVPVRRAAGSRTY